VKVLDYKDLHEVSGGDTTRYVPTGTCTSLAAATMYTVCGNGQITVTSTGKKVWSPPDCPLRGVPYLVQLSTYEFVEVTKYAGNTGYRYAYYVVPY
jgi:hypothetical protein